MPKLACLGEKNLKSFVFVNVVFAFFLDFFEERKTFQN